MKKIMPFLMVILILTIFTACQADTSATWQPTATELPSATWQPSATENLQTQDPAPVATPETPQGGNNSMQIQLTTNGQTAIVELFDNDAARDLMSMLPLTLTFEDYVGIEKISMLERKLNTGDAPTNSDPEIGSFSYYAPWGNLSVFYQDFRQSNALVPLGKFISGIEIFANMNDDFTVTIEAKGT